MVLPESLTARIRRCRPCMDPYAPREQIRRITCRVYGPAQCRALDRLGIPYTPDRDGKPLVLLRDLPHHSARDRQHTERPRLHLI